MPFNPTLAQTTSQPGRPPILSPQSQRRYDSLAAKQRKTKTAIGGGKPITESMRRTYDYRNRLMTKIKGFNIDQGVPR